MNEPITKLKFTIRKQTHPHTRCKKKSIPMQDSRKAASDRSLLFPPCAPQGLFSRITFREPLFVGGPGNTSGLERLPVRAGFRGCVRNLEVNEHRYHFPLAPLGDAINGFDVGESLSLYSDAARWNVFAHCPAGRGAIRARCTKLAAGGDFLWSFAPDERKNRPSVGLMGYGGSVWWEWGWWVIRRFLFLFFLLR